jgi:hypothetical protein
LCIIVCVLLQQYMFIKYMWLDYNSLIKLLFYDPRNLVGRPYLRL